MKLVGVYLSPYVRRVAAAMISRGLRYEHEPVNGYREFEVASRYNPVAKVPSLVLDDGEVLIESSAILDYLNELVPSAPLIPAGSRARRATLKLAAIGHGICEQAIRLSGSRRVPVPESDTERWRAQVLGGLGALDAVAGEGGPLRAAPLDVAGITAIVAVELLALINPDLEFLPSVPRLAEFTAEHRETPPFAADPADALMEDNVNDRVALITGVGDATGDALARRFAQGGYHVAMIARNAERLAELESKIPNAHSYPCDVADLDRLGVVVDRVEVELGAPHVLVHNAVAATFAKIFETSVAELEQNFRVNTTSLFFLAQKLAPAMIERGEGAIMVTGNTSSFRGIPMRPAFAPTKAAQRILAQCLSKDLGPQRVHVGCITIDAAIKGSSWLASAPGARRAGPPADWQHERDDYFAHPDAIADEVYHIAHQHPSTWSFDHVIRPFAESWTLN